MLSLRSRKYGFTLIELMIAVAIVAILATVAYPNLMSQIRKSRRSDAVQALAALQQAQERWRTQHPSYAGNGVIATAWPNGLGMSVRTAGGYYDLKIEKVDPSPVPVGTSYQATAKAVKGTSQASDTGCTTLTVSVGMTINGAADPGKTNYDPHTCWSR